MFPARFAPVLFAFLISGLMSCTVTCVATLKTLGFSDQVLGTWIEAWTFSWPIAFAVILVVGPATRKFVAKLTA